MGSKNTRRTPQRERIMAILKENPKALTAEEIWHKAVVCFPHLALTTVYRNLETMAEQGAVRRSMFSDGVTRFDLMPSAHEHILTCLGCSRTIPLPECPLHALEQELMQNTGFTIQEHRLELYGYCPDCKRNSKPEEDLC